MQLSDRNLRRLFQMELPELMFRGRQETFKFVDRIRLRPASPIGVNQQRLSRFVENAREHFFEGVFDPRVPEALANNNGEECQGVLIAAHHAAHGRFDLLGYRGLDFGDPVDWHLDPVSGRRAPLIHWSRLDPLNCAAIGDTKVIWELNRHQWLVHLGQSWRLTGDPRYAHAVVQQMQAWLQMNPTGMGINWASSLEIAFRLIAWCWALTLIHDWSGLTPAVFSQFEQAVEAQATHVERFLSFYFSPNTHLTGEALGLFYAGVVFPEMKRAERWRSLATQILVQEIERQVLFDGIYFERSTCYQRYTADIYLHFMILAERIGMEVPPMVTKRLKSTLGALVTFRRPDGSIPSIGDADGGMVLALSAASPDDYRATFSTAAVVLRDPVYAWAAGRLASDTVWLLGTRAIAEFEQLEKKSPEPAVCRLFSAGGYVAMRSGWDEKAHALIFDAGPLGCQYSAGHGHADLLSIQCSAFGEQYLVDAGTCCYTADPQVRDFFRSTTAHNTVTVDGRSQAEPAGPFSWRNRCAAQLLGWVINDSFAYADAIHDGYKGFPDPVSHRRRVAFIKSRYWIVIDDLCGSQSHRVDLRFQFAPMQIRIDGPWVRATRNGRQGLLMRAFASVPFDVSVRQGLRDPMEGWLSSNYGCMEPAPALVYSAEAPLPVRIVTLLWPAEDIHEEPDVEILIDDKGRPSGLRHGVEKVVFDDDEITFQQLS